MNRTSFFCLLLICFLSISAVPADPPAPTGLQVTGWKADALRIAWSGRRESAGYRIDVATDSSFTQFQEGYRGRAVGSGSPHTIVSLRPGTVYYVRVSAVGACGRLSKPSKVVAVRTFGASAHEVDRS